MPTRRAGLVALAAITFATARADEPRGTFGFAITVTASGLISPTLKSVTIKDVRPGLPAAQAGIGQGDTVLEVDGVAVPGAKASAMGDRLRKKPGDSVQLKLARPDGQVYAVTLTAVAPPQ